MPTPNNFLTLDNQFKSFLQHRSRGSPPPPSLLSFNLLVFDIYAFKNPKINYHALIVPSKVIKGRRWRRRFHYSISRGVSNRVRVLNPSCQSYCVVPRNKFDLYCNTFGIKFRHFFFKHHTLASAKHQSLVTKRTETFNLDRLYSKCK